MTWTRYRPSKKAVFVMLMIASALALKLPETWTDPLKHVVQALVPAQDLVSGVARRAIDSVEPPDRDAAAERNRRKRALSNALVSQSARIQSLLAENARLSALRESVLPRTIPLLRARVVARDIVAIRDGLLVNRGSKRDVRQKDWVASRFFVDRGEFSGLRAGHAVLARESIVGRVELVSPYMCRVQLLTDVDARPLEVRVGKIADGTLDEVDYICSLRGHGAGEMVITDVPHFHVANEQGTQYDKRRIQIGDNVYSAPDQFGIPVQMVIGTVVRFEEDPRERLVFNVIVKPLVKADGLEEVYVIPTVPTGRIPMPE